MSELTDSIRNGLDGLGAQLTDGWAAELVIDTIGLRLRRLVAGAPLGEAVGFASQRRRRRAVGPTMSEPRAR